MYVPGMMFVLVTCVAPWNHPIVPSNRLSGGAAAGRSSQINVDVVADNIRLLAEALLVSLTSTEIK